MELSYQGTFVPRNESSMGGLTNMLALSKLSIFMALFPHWVEVIGELYVRSRTVVCCIYQIPG